MTTSLRSLRATLAALVLGTSLQPVLAELRLPAVFTENMVLQQGTTVPVWGWADDGEAVAVNFRGQTVSTIARHGQWRVDLKPLKAGGPWIFTVATRTQTVQFTNVLVGEVWVCSGQSNMEFPLSRSYQATADLAAATNARIRLLLVPRVPANQPTNNFSGHWETCSPKNAGGFSAVGYYFGRALQRSRHVPIGLIGTYWGGTPAEAWTSQDALAANPRLKSEIIEGYAAKAQNPAFKPTPWPSQPSVLYNGMIAPLLPYAIRGAIWYQGESNAGRAEQYRLLFPEMIRCWRHDWGRDFPFLLVQLAPFMAIRSEPGDSDWAELRDAQWLATKALPNVGMAVITDVGEEKDIHPKKKEPVGERLALAAQAIAYGKHVEFSGPLYRSQRVQGDQIVLTFDHMDGGLVAKDGELKGFAICGGDGKWVWAKAEIQPNNTIVVSSPQVPAPVAVRFGWADYPVVNLWNKAGLPASPFRTDEFPLKTAGRK